MTKETVLDEEEKVRVAHQVRMYGVTERELRSALEQQAFGNPLMLAMQILSDAQELIEHPTPNSKDLARKYINRSKWVLSKCMEQAIEQQIKFTI